MIESFSRDKRGFARKQRSLKCVSRFATWLQPGYNLATLWKPRHCWVL